MMQHVLQSFESANVISECLRIIVKFLMSSTVNSALYVRELKDSACC